MILRQVTSNKEPLYPNRHNNFDSQTIYKVYRPQCLLSNQYNNIFKDDTKNQQKQFLTEKEISNEKPRNNMQFQDYNFRSKSYSVNRINNREQKTICDQSKHQKYSYHKLTPSVRKLESVQSFEKIKLNRLLSIEQDFKPDFAKNQIQYQVKQLQNNIRLIRLNTPHPHIEENKKTDQNLIQQQSNSEKSDQNQQANGSQKNERKNQYQIQNIHVIKQTKQDKNQVVYQKIIDDKHINGSFAIDCSQTSSQENSQSNNQQGIEQFLLSQGIIRNKKGYDFIKQKDINSRQFLKLFQFHGFINNKQTTKTQIKQLLQLYKYMLNSRQQIKAIDFYYFYSYYIQKNPNKIDLYDFIKNYIELQVQNNDHLEIEIKAKVQIQIKLKNKKHLFYYEKYSDLNDIISQLQKTCDLKDRQLNTLKNQLKEKIQKLCI